MESLDTNPLYVPQRETSGADTFADYGYQYHWALYRAIQEHGKNKEYAVFVELHEDVVLATSLDNSKVEFEFNQVKTTKKKFTPAELCRLKNGSSVLGKLITSSVNKPFSKQISEINLVAVHGFGLALKNEEMKLDCIKVDDLSEDTVKKLASKIKKELSIDDLPSNLQFIIPDLSDKKFQNDIIAELSKLISTLFPSSSYNSVDIYRVLIDELNKRGVVTYDFKNWSELLNKKALTSVTVTKVINQFTSTKDEAKIESEFNYICSNDLQLKTMQRKELKTNFDRYRLSRIGNKSTIQLDLSKSIMQYINEETPSSNGEIGNLVDRVCNRLKSVSKGAFQDDSQMKAAIICEYIIGDA
ncbi:DUF4297 domain-containing protein [Chitinophaga sp. 22321]|uniref:DUF4297 domain-containing protein n=1 Tax=Chitinophaga sp. 22321 TaxID=3453909 RepID=UPI003F83CBF3